MRRRSWFIGLLLPFAFMACGSSDPTTFDPLRQVQADIAQKRGWDPTSLRLYQHSTLLQPGQTIAPALGANGSPGKAIEITQPTWFFWADMAPLKYFEHPTHFILMDEDGANMRVIDQNWPPLIDGNIFLPEDAVWGVANTTSALSAPPAADVGKRASALTSEQLQCEGKPNAVIIQGFGHPFVAQALNASVARLATDLAKRDYKVHRVTPREFATPQKLWSGLLKTLESIAKDRNTGRLDIFYLGHGAHNGGLVFVLDGNPITSFTIADMLEPLKSAGLSRLRFVIDSCHSAAFTANLRAEADKYEPLRAVPMRALSSSTAAQKSNVCVKHPSYPWCKKNGSEYTERLLDVLEAQTEPVYDFKAVEVQGFDTKAHEAGKVVDVRQDPQNTPASPGVPVLFVAYDAETTSTPLCAEAGHLPVHAYERKVFLQGMGFGDAKGTVAVSTGWDISVEYSRTNWTPRPLVEVPVAEWSDELIVIKMPMRNKGYPSDPNYPGLSKEVNLPRSISTYTDELGHYFVQVTRADGKKSRDFSSLPTYDKHWSGTPYLIHVLPQVYTLDWIPKYTDEKKSIGWNEMWHPHTPSSAELGKYTILASHLRWTTEPLPSIDSSVNWSDPAQGSQPHTTGDSANTGGWAYELSPGEYNPATAKITADPKFSYWGFRQLFTPPWDTTETWRFLLVYD